MYLPDSCHLRFRLQCSPPYSHKEIRGISAVLFGECECSKRQDFRDETTSRYGSTEGLSSSIDFALSTIVIWKEGLGATFVPSYCNVEPSCWRAMRLETTHDQGLLAPYTCDSLLYQTYAISTRRRLDIVRAMPA